jgi:hypothetical protein
MGRERRTLWGARFSRCAATSGRAAERQRCGHARFVKIADFQEICHEDMLRQSKPQALSPPITTRAGATMSLSELSAREFEARFRALSSAGTRDRSNAACVECERCTGCSFCTFCKDSERLVRSHFCVRCAMCTDCAHCRGCRGLIGCQHCIDCDGCLHSSYLTRCLSLSNCQYCFGCVGLSGRDFHILNEPCERKTYFRIVERLTRELRL